MRQMELLRHDVDTLKRQSQTTTVLRPVATDTGRLVLVNQYPTEVTVMVNQGVYRLQPNERRHVPLPAGPFTYWVPLSQSLVQNRTLQPNETLTITVR
jgi:hypothetical protein